MFRFYRIPVLSVVAFSLALGLLWPAAAQARKIYDEFNYQFDSGGVTHDFAVDEEMPKESMNWHPGGAMGSIGCLRVQGPDVKVERYEWFKVNDSTFSMHVKSSGYGRGWVQFVVAPGSPGEGFGAYSRHPLPELTKGEWQWVQIKLSDLKGEKGAMAKPDMVFKSFKVGFEGGAADAIVLLDNIRVGPATSEKDIKVRVKDRSLRVVGRKVRTLLDFEDPADCAKLIDQGEGVPLKIAQGDKGVTSGKKSARVEAEKGQEYTGFNLDTSLLKDWQDFDFLVFDVYSDDPAFTGISVELWDEETMKHTGHEIFTNRATYDSLNPLHQGKNSVMVDLRRARRNGKEGVGWSELKKGDRIDLSKLTRVKSWISTAGKKTNYVYYMDNVRLVQEGALESNMKIALPKGAKAFDMGDDTPLVEGFTEANLTDVYSKEIGYGFVNPRGLKVEGRDWPDPLAGDYIAGGHDADGNWQSAEFEFRIDAPDGEYLAWVCAGMFPNPGLHYDLNVNGELVFSGETNWKRFYGKSWFYRFYDTNYSEKPGALWRDYVAKIAPGLTFKTTVKNGSFFVKGQNAFLAAVILLPASEQPAFDQMVKQIETERTRFFYQGLYLMRPPNEPCVMQDPKMLLFAPAQAVEILPWSGMTKADSQKVSLLVTPGEATAFQVAIRPFADLGEAEVSISDLKGPDGATIAKDAASIYFKKYLSDGQTVRNFALRDTAKATLENNLTVGWWLRMRIPTDAKPGAYTGVVTATAGSEVRSLPISVQVYPFKLADNVPVAFGLYYAPPDQGQFIFYDSFKDAEAQAARDKLLKEQMEIMRDFGLTSTDLPAPTVTKLQSSSAAVDLTQLEKTADAAKAAGMAKNPQQTFISNTLGAARTIGRLLDPAGAMTGPGDELKLEGLQPAFVSVIQQVVEWSNDKSTPILLWVVDEPRETPNPWNRNLKDTLAYCDMAHKVKGAQVMVTPMGDENAGKDYMPLLDHLDVVSTHPSKHSQKMIQKAMDDPKLGLHMYNGGRDRLSNGFYIWRVGATGKFEWHFCQWVMEPKGYRGRDMFNPFLNYEGDDTFMPVPLTYKGGVLPREGMMTMSVGINDYRYVLTLEQELAKARTAANNAALVTEVDKYLAEVRSMIPVTPDIKGYGDAGNLADVGAGIEGDISRKTDDIRQKMAEYIVKFQK